MQKRWVAGIVYASGFLVGFCWLMVVALGIIIAYYRMAFDFDYEPETPNIMAMLPPLAIAVMFYLANLFDVVIAQLRIQQQAIEDFLTTEHTEDPRDNPL